MTRITPFACLGLLLLSALAGCTSRTQEFPGYSASQVWSALTAVAESPEYDDWRMTMNEVWVDEEQARIEVYRELRRNLRRADARPLNERRTWRFQILLDGEDPPQARFVSRGMGVPGHAVAEAERFFADVRAVLAPLEPAAAAEAEARAAAEAEAKAAAEAQAAAEAEAEAAEEAVPAAQTTEEPTENDEPETHEDPETVENDEEATVS